jgi:hypothetical protein
MEGGGVRYQVRADGMTFANIASFSSGPASKSWASAGVQSSSKVRTVRIIRRPPKAR